MKPYSKLPAQEQSTITVKGILNYNYFVLQSAVQSILQHNQDMSFHKDINTCLERCISDLDSVFSKHSKPPHNENETKDTTIKDA